MMILPSRIVQTIFVQLWTAYSNISQFFQKVICIVLWILLCRFDQFSCNFGKYFITNFRQISLLVKMLKMKKDWIFQQGSNPNRIFKLTMEFLQERKIIVWKQLSQFPDLNTVNELCIQEDLRIFLTRRVRKIGKNPVTRLERIQEKNGRCHKQKQSYCYKVLHSYFVFLFECINSYT